MPGHNDHVTAKHWQDELCNCIFQLNNNDLKACLSTHPVEAERLRVAMAPKKRVPRQPVYKGKI